MRANHRLLSALLLSALGFSSCEKQTEEVVMEDTSEYQPLSVGKFITYRLDSTVFVNFGRDEEIRSFEEKHVIDAEVLDAQGRPAFRVFRFTRDTAGLEAWRTAGTYFITISNNTVEVSENNLRSLRLVDPLKLDFEWKGNRYLPTEPYGSTYNFSNDDYMYDWDFTYENKEETLQLKNHLVENVVTIKHIDESINVPISTPAAYASINYAVDKYAKGLGLVYQELEMWEYQPNPGGPSGYKTGFGVKRSMIDHN
jgi:hypothetical protein